MVQSGTVRGTPRSPTGPANPKSCFRSGIVSIFSLIHIPSVEIPDTLKEFNRVLKPGGFLLLIVQKGKADHITEEPLDKTEKTFINFFTREKLTSSLNAGGFEIVEQEDIQTPAQEFQKSDAIIYTIAKNFF